MLNRSRKIEGKKMDKKVAMKVLMLPSYCSRVPREYIQINDLKEEKGMKNNEECSGEMQSRKYLLRNDIF